MDKKWKNKKNIIFKILEMIGTLFFLSILVFVLARCTPGDPLRAYYGDGVERMSMEQKEDARERLGLNQKIPVQYGIWLKEVIHGNWGISYQYKQPVTEIMLQYAKNTVLLGGIAYLLTFFVALIIGCLCVYWQKSAFDRFVCKIGTICSCIPEFWIALLFILIFAVNLKILPSGGVYSIGKSKTILDTITHLILPVSVLMMGHVWYYANLLRNRLIEETKKDYVIFAFSKGRSRMEVLVYHCLRAAMPYYLSLMVLSVPHILGGTYLVEKVFSYAGLGTLCFESAKYHDYNLLMVVSLLTAVIVIFFNMVAQILCEKIDPRMDQELIGVGESVL